MPVISGHFHSIDCNYTVTIHQTLVQVDRYSITFRDDKHLLKCARSFAANDELITSINAQELPYKLGHNQFSHLSAADFAAVMRMKEMRTSMAHQDKPLWKEVGEHERKDESESPLPTTVDWVRTGAVTPVKNQGACGSCWAFSTVGGVEGVYATTTARNISQWNGFSEQQLVSCDRIDSGCNGGSVDVALEWIKRNGGICTEDEYVYTAGDGSVDACRRRCKVETDISITGVIRVNSTENALMEAVARQPVSAAIEADQAVFQLYSSGVLTARCGANLDHAILVVGYGVYDELNYWQIKNSWGTTWGMDGYMLLDRGDSDDHKGKCGILLSASYPSVS